MFTDTFPNISEFKMKHHSFGEVDFINEVLRKMKVDKILDEPLTKETRSEDLEKPTIEMCYSYSPEVRRLKKKNSNSGTS